MSEYQNWLNPGYITVRRDVNTLLSILSTLFDNIMVLAKVFPLSDLSYIDNTSKCLKPGDWFQEVSSTLGRGPIVANTPIAHFVGEMGSLRVLAYTSTPTVRSDRSSRYPFPADSWKAGTPPYGRCVSAESPEAPVSLEYIDSTNILWPCHWLSKSAKGAASATLPAR